MQICIKILTDNPSQIVHSYKNNLDHLKVVLENINTHNLKLPNHRFNLSKNPKYLTLINIQEIQAKTEFINTLILLITLNEPNNIQLNNLPFIQFQLQFNKILPDTKKQNNKKIKKQRDSITFKNKKQYRVNSIKYQKISKNRIEK